MTIQELYEWAIRNDVVDKDIEILDKDGDKVNCIEPQIDQYTMNGFTYTAVELRA